MWLMAVRMALPLTHGESRTAFNPGAPEMAKDNAFGIGQERCVRYRHGPRSDEEGQLCEGRVRCDRVCHCHLRQVDDNMMTIIGR